ncbi:MAG TPA: cysteine--tRNA ligase [Candidatus Kapabacteria bacterium]
MALQLYNTLSREKELFTPINAPNVGMYVCGPTVYSDTHIGHAKSYITFDIVRRYLTFLGYEVTHVQNITDVGHMVDNDDEGEDKLVLEAARRKMHPKELSETYTHRFWDDLKKLNILTPHIQPLASGHIIEQIEIIKELIAKGFAYEVKGNVYFDITKDADYGKLSGRKTEDQEASGRVDARSDKRNPQDFALWKRAEGGHIMRWASPWGDGFPGWHIECSAMSMKYLGQTIDIHGGGIENQFPHHECEIAQSESATGKQFVKYWLHNNMVTVDGKKMGKSVGNSSFLVDLFQEFDPMTLRFFILQSHYRSTTEFKKDAIQAAETGYKKLLATYERLSQVLDDPEVRLLTDLEKEHPIYKQFVADMDDDFNSPKAIASLFDLSRETNDELANNADKAKLDSLYQLWRIIGDDVLGIIPTHHQAHSPQNKDEILDSVLKTVINWRMEARASKDFKMSDSIRDDMAKAGVVLEDGKDGTSWSIKES